MDLSLWHNSSLSNFNVCGIFRGNSLWTIKIILKESAHLLKVKLMRYRKFFYKSPLAWSFSNSFYCSDFNQRRTKKFEKKWCSRVIFLLYFCIFWLNKYNKWSVFSRFVRKILKFKLLVRDEVEKVNNKGKYNKLVRKENAIIAESFWKVF